MSLISDAYESRADRNAAIIARRDPVVYHAGGAPPATGLSRTELQAYSQHGFVVRHGFFSRHESAALLRELQRMTKDPETLARHETVREPDGAAPRAIFGVHVLSPLFSRLVRDRRLLAVVRQILGSGAYIHQSRIELKPDFAGERFYWRSDFETWHVEDGMPAMRAVSCSILLTANNEVNGPLLLIPGSHQHFIACAGETPSEPQRPPVRAEPDPDSLRFLVERGGIKSVLGPPGTVVFYDCNTMHGSNSNISPYPRSNLCLVFNSVENVLGAPKHGLDPRPEFLAARADVRPLRPIEPSYLQVAADAGMGGPVPRA